MGLLNLSPVSADAGRGSGDEAGTKHGGRGDSDVVCCGDCGDRHGPARAALFLDRVRFLFSLGLSATTLPLTIIQPTTTSTSPHNITDTPSRMLLSGLGITLNRAPRPLRPLNSCLTPSWKPHLPHKTHSQLV